MNLNERIDRMNDLKSKTRNQMTVNVDVNTISPEERLKIIREVMNSFDYAGVRVKSLEEPVGAPEYIVKTIEVGIDGGNIKMGKTSNPTLLITVDIGDGTYVRKGS